MTPNLLRYFACAYLAFTMAIPFLPIRKEISFMAIPAVGMLCYQLCLLMLKTERQTERIKRLEQQIDRLMSEPEALRQ